METITADSVPVGTLPVTCRELAVSPASVFQAGLPPDQTFQPCKAPKATGLTLLDRVPACSDLHLPEQPQPARKCYNVAEAHTLVAQQRTWTCQAAPERFLTDVIRCLKRTEMLGA